MRKEDNSSTLRDHLDLDPCAAWKCRDLDRRSSGKIFCEVLSINSVDDLEVGEVDQKNSRLDNVAKSKTRRAQHLADIVQHLTCLEFDSAGHQRSGLRI